MSKRNFEQKKRFLRSLPAGRISHFTSRIYQSLAEVSDANDFENAKSHAKKKALLRLLFASALCLYFFLDIL